MVVKGGVDPIKLTINQPSNHIGFRRKPVEAWTKSRMALGTKVAR